MPNNPEKTDSEMSEEGDKCKPEQPSIPLQLTVVLRNATTNRQKKAQTAADESDEDMPFGAPQTPKSKANVEGGKRKREQKNAGDDSDADDVPHPSNPLSIATQRCPPQRDYHQTGPVN
eukprot:CAMPEP_0179446506 /NCGR_PEP_ID=MMETSP0799-20121207/29944_1 /TAXON_ID=46947 /ORGANISM="Geminigera cryophila, Strain CCMP2564" /LENGTH=118 /DNA_ID=CAMNT_0021235601 /DNA_START=246 /DNA_END=606 /DNA_ORIENTATION=+